MVTNMYKKILVGVDWSDASLKAAEKAADLANRMGAELTLLTVVPPPTVFLGEMLTPEIIDTSPMAEAARNKLRELADQLRNSREGLKINHAVIIGEPGEELVAYAVDNGYDLMVLGKRKLSGLERFILGSVTKKVLEKSPVDILVVT
jgi:nucleotide-binding universal stress UspA family protein